MNVGGCELRRLQRLVGVPAYHSMRAGRAGPHAMEAWCALVLGAWLAITPAASANAAEPWVVEAASAHAEASAGPGTVASGDRGSIGGGPSRTLPTIEVHAVDPDAALRAHRRLVPGAVDVVDGGTFYERPVANMADALRYVAGVLIHSSTGGDDGILSIRGSNLTALNYANSGVALFQDGLPVTTADGNNHNRFVDPLTARAVIVANGANALTYGASTLGGAIDFISRTARNSDPRKAYLMGGAYGLYDGRVSLGGQSGDTDGIVTLAGKHFDGWRDHSRESRVSANGSVGWQASDDFRLRFFGDLSNDREQLAGSLTRAEFDANPRQADPSYALGNHQKNVKTARAAVKGTWDIDADSQVDFGLSLEHQSLYHPIVDVYDFHFDPARKYYSLLIDLDQRTTGGMARYHRKAGNHDLIAGVNLTHTSNTGSNYENNEGRPGARTGDIDQQAGNATLFLVDRWGFEPHWTLVYGAQGVVTSRDVQDENLAQGSVRHQKATYSSINPRIGLIRQLGSDAEAFASVSRVYGPPTNFDLDNDVRQDDSTLDATQGIAFEVGARGAFVAGPDSAGWRWSLAWYHARLHDEILSVENPAQPGTMLSTNYDRTVHAGVEAMVGAELPVNGGAYRIEPLISFTWNDFGFEGDPVFGDNRLPYAPNYVLHGEVMLRNPRTGLYAGPTVDLVGHRYADMANTYEVGGHALVGLRAGIERDRWSVFLEVANLTDEDYVGDVSVRTLAGPDARVLNPGAPRSVFLGARIRY